MVYLLLIYVALLQKVHFLWFNVIFQRTNISTCGFSISSSIFNARTETMCHYIYIISSHPMHISVQSRGAFLLVVTTLGCTLLSLLILCCLCFDRDLGQMDWLDELGTYAVVGIWWVGLIDYIDEIMHICWWEGLIDYIDEIMHICWWEGLIDYIDGIGTYADGMGL